MTQLSIEDEGHLEAALGWLGLGNYDEAHEELEQIPQENRGHPEVLKACWWIHAHATRWDAALEIASALIALVPQQALGWVLRSSCLQKLQRIEEARDNLLRVVARFPEEPIMRYNLACYECQLQRLKQAKDWLRRAFDAGDPREIRSIALEDPNLEPLWKHIGEI